MKILLMPGSYTSPSSRFRIWQFVDPLKKLGHEVKVRVIHPERNWSSSYQYEAVRNFHQRLGTLQRVCSAIRHIQSAGNFDVIMMNRDLIPETRIDFLETWLCRKNPHIIFDFDDAIHLGNRSKKLEKILPHFAWITPGNEYLASYARQLNQRVTVWPTVVDTDSYQPVKARKPGPIRIGWSGSQSTIAYCLPLLKNIIIQLAKTEDFEFIVIAEVPPILDWPGVKWRYIPWTPDSEVAGLQEIDIGLMPLRDEPFERGKCGLKGIQYMGVGIPTLVSPVGVNKEIVLHGETGFHCFSNEEWLQSLRLLIHNPKLRKEMGRAGRIRVEEDYSIRSLLPKMQDIFEKVAHLR
jgi:glycosyltransferase involved in cell wall biosynthesis